MSTTVTASDGVSLAVHAYTEIDKRRPTILAIHGYPDNHHVWDGVADPTIPPLALVAPGDAFAGTAGGEAMLSNSFAFGGSNVALVLGRNEAKRP